MRFFTLVVSLFLICSTLAFAHSPSKINISIEETNLEIEVFHPVSNPKRHYVEKITVTLNGKKVVEQRFSLQPENVQNAIYNIPSLQEGDVLGVEASCNIHGKLKIEITVEQEKEEKEVEEKEKEDSMHMEPEMHHHKH